MSTLHYQIGHGDIAAVCADGQEVIRRIFVSVRDRNWREIPPSQFHAEPDSGVQDKLILRARHTSGLVDFEWQGFLQVKEETDANVLHFEFAGSVLRDMEVCRLGLIVLHPVIPLVGNRVTVEGPEGRQEILISEYLHPQPIRGGLPQGMTLPFARLSVEMTGIGPVDLTFTGDLFELEDQRNWGDASFKTYCTPLRLGFPRAVKAGTVIKHSVKVSVRKKEAAGARSAASKAAVVPRIGRMAPESFGTIENAEWAQGWDHVRVDLKAGIKPEAIERLLGLLPPAVTLELGLTVDEPSGIAPGLIGLLGKYRQRLSALLLRSAGSPLPSGQAVARLRELLRGGPAGGIPLLAAPNGYFVEFNRGAPFPENVDGIAFPLSSTVHSDDPDTILENIPTVIDMVRTARHLAGKPLIAISPLALYHPGAGNHNRIPHRVIMPWLSRVLALAGSAGVSSITIAEDVIDPHRGASTNA